MLDLCVEFLNIRERGAEGVSFNNESFGDLGGVRHHVRDVLFCGSVYDFAEQGLTRAAGGR